MDDLKNELQEVKKELGMIEQYLQEMLERQNNLVERKVELESLIKRQEKRTAEAMVASTHDWKHEENYSTSSDYPWNEKLKSAMKNVFSMETFRPLQEKTINATMSGRDCILIMPTGGGKSLCFQLPAVISDGVTLVISPLVSLMEDQLMSLQGLGVDAALLNASSSKLEVKNVQEAMISKTAGLKLLYVTPEKVAKSKRFMAKVEKMYEMGRLARIAIDEVHCCSQWGHDFRPDYKILGILKRQFPGTPVIGLTATATTKVIENVKCILNIPNCVLYKASFNRPNLFYEVRPKPSNHTAMMTELQQIIESRFNRQSGIIYCFSKKDTDDVCRDLQSRGVKAGCYHADMDAAQRSYVHRKWLANEIHVVVATIAFGMGIDKPNVRFVIHHSISKSMENYYQESGRAGRDDQPATCIMYFRLQDMFRQSTMVFTEQTGLNNLYKMIAYCIDCSKCRRTQIARHFGERWESSQCNKMCDYCRNKDEVFIQRIDMSSECRTVLEVLETASMKDQKLTGLKVMDAVMSKLKKTSLTRDDLEKVLAKMILDGYLREDFHFTPYSTISYLTPGAMAQVLSTSSTRVMMDFVRKKTKRITDTTSRLRPTSAQGSPDTSILKPKLSIVNPQKSMFTTDMVTVFEDHENDIVVKVEKNDWFEEHDDEIVVNIEKNGGTECSKSSSKKRKSYDLTRDSGDDDDFDFGEDVKLKPCKVSRIAGSSGKVTSASGRSKKRRADDSSDDSDWTDLDISGIEPLEMSVAANDPAHDSTFEMEAPADPGPADTKLTHQNKCQECGKVFPRKQSLKRHRSTHDSRLRHHCEICGKGYCERFRVARHMEEKHTSKRVMCDICGKQFINNASLQVHVDAHNDKYRYRCRVCNKGFTHKSYLEPHMEVHGKPVPRHKCPTCGKEFKTKPGLGSHVNHCGKEGAEFKFHCKICVKGFKEKRYLREHEKRHENPNYFRCDVCGQNYGYSASLYKHKKNAH